MPGLPVISSPHGDVKKSMPMPKSKVNIRELRDQEKTKQEKKQAKDVLSTRTQELKAIKAK
jgi:hypothetical protein